MNWFACQFCHNTNCQYEFYYEDLIQKSSRLQSAVNIVPSRWTDLSLPSSHTYTRPHRLSKHISCCLSHSYTRTLRRHLQNDSLCVWHVFSKCKAFPSRVVLSSLRISPKQTVSYMKQGSHFLSDYIILLFSGTEGRSVSGWWLQPSTYITVKYRETQL